MSEIKVDAAIGGEFDVAAKLIEVSGKEDSSGLRRWIVLALAEDKYDDICKELGISQDVLADCL